MKKFCALAVASLGALSVGVAAPSMAAPGAGSPMPHPKVSVSGNLEHTSMQFWCSKGMPNYLVAVRAAKTPEKTVTFSEPQLHETHTMGPLTHAKPLFIFSTINQAGKTITITVKGNTTGSTFSVTGTIPATCKGLPTIQPNGTVTPPAGKPTTGKPTPGKPAPGKPMPGKPGPVKPGMPAPMKPMPGKTAGPKVETDYVASKSTNTTGELALAGLGLAGLAGASAIARRR